MSAQMLRDNPDRLHTDKSLLKLAKVRDGNDAGPEVIQTRAISIQENVWKNENSEEEIMENIIKEEDGETRIVRLCFARILHTLTESTNENIEERVADETSWQKITRFVQYKKQFMQRKVEIKSDKKVQMRKDSCSQNRSCMEQPKIK